MRFAFTDDQLAFADAVRDLLADTCPPAAVRRAWDAPADSAVDRDRWRALAEMGVVGMLLPEAHGGLGLGELDLVLLVEEAGRVALPDPLIDVAAVGAPLIADVAPPEVVERWLAPLAGGQALVGVQHGGTPAIAGGSEADVLILVHDDEVHLVPRDQVTCTLQDSVDGARKLVLIDWHRVSETVIARGEVGWAGVNRAFDRGALATAAFLVGLADTMIAMTVDYVTERHQFGVPVGSFQAVKHQLADAYLRLEFARPVVYRAAHSLAHGAADPHRSRDVSMAKVYAAEAAHLAARTALQCHGAIGYTVEHDLHLFMKRAWALVSEWGTPAWHRDRVATAVLGPASVGSPGSDPNREGTHG